MKTNLNSSKITLRKKEDLLIVPFWTILKELKTAYVKAIK